MGIYFGGEDGVYILNIFKCGTIFRWVTFGGEGTNFQWGAPLTPRVS